MKTRIIALFAGLLAVLPMTSAWADLGGHSTHYGKLSVSLANGCTGMGKVYVGTSGSATEGEASRTWNCGGKSGSDANAFYCITEPTDSAKYEFDGWFTSADATGTPESTSKAYKPSFSASSTSSGSPTAKTYYAKFHELVLFTVNFNQPSEGGSYTVKDGSTSITDASVTQMATMSLTLTPTINEGYAFVRWDITQGGKTTQNANKTVSNLKVTSDTTIALVLRKMPYYTVTFVPPENGGSYAVDGTAVGADGTSKSGYDSVSAKLTATPASGWKMGDKGWYTLDGDGKKTYFSQAESISSQKFEANVTVGVDFVEKTHFDVTFLPAANGTYTAENVEETGSQVTVAGQEGVVRGFDTLKAKLVATPAKGYVLDKWYKVNDDGSSEYIATTATANYTFEGAAKAGAIFTPRKQVAVTVQGEGFTCTCTNDAIDYEETETGFVGYDSAALTFTATANPTQRAKWWYKTSEDAEPTYFSMDRSMTKTFDEDVIVGVEYEAITGSLADLIANAEGSEVTLAADANVPEGTSAEIPAGMTVTVPSGVTLWVDGTLTVNGTLTAEGTVSKCSKILRQTGNGIVPCDCYGTKYWKSAIESSKASVSWAGGTPSLHLSACSADGRVVRGAITANTKFVNCTFGTGAAKNSIKSIGAASELANIAEGSFILLDNVTITDPIVTEQSKYKRLSGTRTIEAAGKTVSVTYSQVSSNFRADTFNGTINFKASSYWQGGKGAFYNCKSITVNKLKNASNYFDLYDSGDTMSFSQYEGGTTRLLVYGTKTTFDFSKSLVDSATTKIYGGAFKVRPADSLRGDTSKEFYLEDDGYYHLEPRRDTFVAKIGDTTYDSIGDALGALVATDEATLTLYSPVTVAEPFTLPAGKSLTVELGGCRIDAPNGFIKNYGTLVIRDNDNKLEQSMIVTANGANVVETFDGGKTDICYGRYQGDFTVNGGILTTHHGLFYGSVVKNGGEVWLLGGQFSTDVSDLMGDGYVAFLRDGLYYAARFPEPACVKSSVAEFGFTLTAMESSEKSLYVNKALLSVAKCANADEWMHVAELKSTYEMWGHYYFDILLKVDRDVADRTTKATVKSFGEYLPALTGGTEQRVFTPQITQTKISYKRFINDTEEHNYDTLTAGMDNYSDANIGTTFTLTMELWNWEPGSDKNDPNRPMHSYLTILTRPYVFGAGSNVAMLQTPSGRVPDANFFPSLAAAVASAATTDKTIKLCNNCAETVKVGKSCVIDTNGFMFEGRFETGAGVTETVEGTVHAFTAEASSSVAQIGEATYETLQAAIDAVPTATVTEDMEATQIDVLGGCDEEIVVERACCFRIADPNGQFTGSIDAGELYKMTAEDGVYRFVEAVAKVGSVRCEAIYEAMNMVKPGDQIVLLRDCSGQVTIGADWTLHLNGHALDGIIGAVDGYVVRRTGDICRAVKVVAKVGDAEFTSLKEAISFVKWGAKPVEVNLCADCDETIALPDGVTVNRNNHDFNGRVDPPYGYVLKVEDDSIVVYLKYVASIGSIQYETLDEAVAAAGRYDVVKLLKDVPADFALGSETAPVAKEFQIASDGFAFSMDNIGRMAEGFEKSFDEKNDLYVVSHPTVAKVGEDSYSSLAEAIEAAMPIYDQTDGKGVGTVKLVWDCDEDVVIDKAGVFSLVPERRSATDGATYAFTGSIGTSNKDMAVFTSGNIWKIAPANVYVVSDKSKVKVSSAVGEVSQEELEEKIAQATQEGYASVSVRNGVSEVDTVVSETGKLAAKDQESGIYQPTKVVTINNETISAPDADAAPVAVLKNANSDETIFLAVPGNYAENGEEITIKNVVAKGMEEGDLISFYPLDKNGKTSTLYYQWKYENGSWVDGTTFGKDGELETPSADTKDLIHAGDSLVYKRNGHKNPIVVVAKYESNVATKVKEAGTSVQPAWNVVANSKIKGTFDLNDIQGNEVKEASDKIVVTTRGLGQRVYTRKNGNWGYTEGVLKTIGNVKVLVSKRNEDDTVLENGKGFWYVSGGGQPTIPWNNEDETAGPEK